MLHFTGTRLTTVAGAVLSMLTWLPAVAAQGDREAEILSRAYAALAAGRAREALQLADSLLSATPRHHGAATVAVRAAAASNSLEGLAQYERWLAAARTEDAHMLEPVAVAALRELAATKGPAEAAAHSTLSELDRGPAADSPGARQEAEGQQIVARLTSRDSGNKVLLLRALGASGYRAGGAAVLPLLDDQSPDVRAAAAETLGELRVQNAVSHLRGRLADPASEVRSAAALALRRLGDGSGDALVAELLSSDMPDLQIQAAEALRDEAPSNWAPYIEPLLMAEAPMTRLHAARLLLPVDPDRAGAAIAAMLDNPNPVVVGEIGRVLVENGLSDLPTIRRLLRHATPEARIHGANALLRLTAAVSGG